MIDVIYKKQMCNRVIMGKKMRLKSGIVLGSRVKLPHISQSHFSGYARFD